MLNDKRLIFLVRHGRTALNVQQVFRGHLDGPLDDVGIRQSEQTGELLQDIDLGTIYTSPLERSVQTAAIISNFQKNGTEVLPEEGFMDLSYGVWEGKTYEEAEEEYPDVYDVWKRDPRKAVIPQAETLTVAKKRIWRAFERILANSSTASLAIVSHRVVNKLLLTGILGLSESDFWKVQQDTCCVNVIEYKNGEFTVLKVNHNAHIMSMKKSFEIVDF